MSLTIFADESKSRGFRLAATVIADRDTVRCRSEMSRLRRGPTRRIHFVKEMNSTRKAILTTIGTMPVAHLLIDVEPLHGARDPRERALVSLVHLAHKLGATTVVLERDPSTLEKDRRTLFAASRALEDGAGIRYRQLAAHEEPLLWIPDAIAWSWTRGGEWRQLVLAMNTQVIRI